MYPHLSLIPITMLHCIHTMSLLHPVPHMLSSYHNAMSHFLTLYSRGGVRVEQSPPITSKSTVTVLYGNGLDPVPSSAS